jgi:hypothetical protein
VKVKAVRSLQRGVAGRRRDVAGRRLSVPWARLLGATGLVAASAALYWATTDPAFAIDPATVPVTGARYTPADAIDAALALPDRSRLNIFRIPTRDMEARLAALPAVRRAAVRATLPDRITVTLEERLPIMLWRQGEVEWLADVEGVLFAPADAANASERGTGATATDLPVFEERRDRGPLSQQDRLPDLDLAVVRLLLAIGPDDVGSSEPALFAYADDSDGYVLEAPGAWRAIFGHYTPTLRPPDIIPAQVQCLRALMADREGAVGEVRLALSDDRCGTFRQRSVPRATPRATGRGGGGEPTAGPGRRSPNRP